MRWEITPQGYIKTTAKITKGGELEYRGHEIGLNDDAIYKVNRTIEELEKPDTLQSFDGLPLTITHPNDQVTNENWKDKTVGHIQNVRREDNYIVCDAYIQDKSAIDLLKNKEIRELSVGYEPAEIIERGGNYYHENIRANHVAIVAKGRAGADCRLQDSKTRGKIMSLNSIMSMFKGVKLSDSGEATLTKEQVQETIASLEVALKEVEGKEDDTSKETAEELQKQIDELKAKLDSNVQDEDVSTDENEKLAQLVAEVEALKAERDELLKRLEQIQETQETQTVLTDAQKRFPKVKLSDAKNAKDIRIAVLVDNGVYTLEEAQALDDNALIASYTAIQAMNKPKSDIGKALFADSKKEQTIDYTKAFSSKRGEK